MEYFFIIFIRIFSKLSKFLFEIGLKFFMLPEEYGKFVILISNTLIISSFLNLGINNFIIKKLTISKEEEKKEYISQIILLNIFIIFILFIINTVIKLEPYILEISVLLSLCGLISSITQSQFEITYAIFFLEIQWYVIFFILFIFFRKDVSYLNVTRIYCFSLLINFILGLNHIKIKKYINLKLKKIKIVEIILSSFPTLFTGFAYTVLSRMDILMLKKYSSLSQLGDYNVVARISVQILFFLQVLLTIYLPKLAKSFGENTMFHINEENKKIKKIAILIVTITIFLFFIFDEYFNIFRLFEINVMHRKVLYIFILEKLLYTYIFLNSYIIYFSNNEKYMYINSVFMLIFNYILNKIFIPEFGIIGAGISTFITVLISHFIEALEIYLLNKELKDSIFDKKNFILLLVNLLMILFYIYFKYIFILFLGLGLNIILLFKMKEVLRNV